MPITADRAHLPRRKQRPDHTVDRRRPASGALNVSALNSAGTVTYMPNEGFSGDDQFTFRATDPAGLTSQPAAAAIVVHAPPGACPARTGTTASGACPARAPTAACAARTPTAASGAGRGHQGAQSPARADGRQLTRKGIAALRITCPTDEKQCTGLLTLISVKKLDLERILSAKQRIILGKATYTITGSRTKRVKIQLSTRNHARHRTGEHHDPGARQDNRQRRKHPNNDRPPHTQAATALAAAGYPAAPGAEVEDAREGRDRVRGLRLDDRGRPQSRRPYGRLGSAARPRTGD